MEEKSRQILSELYALRAGLSVISEQKDKTVEIIEKTDNKIVPFGDELFGNMLWYTTDHYGAGEVYVNKIGFNREPKFCFSHDYKYTDADVCCFDGASCGYSRSVVETEFPKNRIEHGRKHRAYLEEILRNGKFKQEIDAICKEGEKNLSGVEVRNKTYKKRAPLSIIPLALSIVAIIVSVLAFSANPLVLGIGIAVGAVLLIVGLILLIINLKGMSFTKSRILYYKKKIAEMRDIEAESLKKFAQLEEWKKQANAEMIPYKEVTDTVYNALVQNYNGLIDPRDWQFLDLIIYYFETGRAVDMREALQLLDRERQTQQIVGAVREATQLICRSIQNAFASLENTMRLGFASLQSSINNGFAQMSAIGAAQLKEMKLNNALMQKANASSEQLANDVHYMRSKYFY